MRPFILVISNNLSVRNSLTLFILYLLLLFIVIPIMLGSLPSGLIMGSSLLFLFMFSFSFWFVSLLASEFYLLRFSNLSVVSTLFIFLFDTFVMSLRPVTLTLRVLINVTLGHFLIMFIHLSYLNLIYMVWALELFVYTVQCYVFSTLAKSYLEVSY